MNVSGHRISTTEVESALVDHSSVAEAAVVGANDDVTGQAIIGYVILRGGNDASTELGNEIRSTWGRSWARSPGPRRWSSCPTCPRPGRARSCVACCAMWLTGAVGRHHDLADPGVVAEIAERAAEGPDEDEPGRRLSRSSGSADPAGPGRGDTIGGNHPPPSLVRMSWSTD